MGGVNLWGQPTTFTVGAVGTGDLLYQWYFNGLALAGATSNSFSFGAIQFTNAGLYSVVVSSSLGSAKWRHSAPLGAVGPPRSWQEHTASARMPAERAAAAEAGSRAASIGPRK
jgi:hypothetical protein